MITDPNKDENAHGITDDQLEDVAGGLAAGGDMDSEQITQDDLRPRERL